MNTTTPAATGTRTRTRTAEKSADRDHYVEACIAGRECIERLLAHKPKGTAAYKVTLALIAQVTLWSRTSESGHNISTRKIAEMTGLDLRTVRRTLTALVDAGIIRRISTAAEKGQPVKTGAIISMPVEALTRHKREQDQRAAEVVDNSPGTDAEAVQVIQSTPSPPVKFTPSTRSTPENEKKGLCEEVSLPSRASDVGQSDGPTSLAPGEAVADGTRMTAIDPHPDVAGLHPDAQAAYAAALEKATTLLAGGEA